MVILRGQKDLKIYLERELQTLFILALLDFRRFKSITDPLGSKKSKGNFHLSRTTAGDNDKVSSNSHIGTEYLV